MAEDVTAFEAEQLALFTDPRPLEWRAYLAGLLDGEGCIGVFASEECHVAKVKVSMCERAPLDELHSHYGGGLNLHRPSNPMWRDSWGWTVTGRGCIAPLRDALPFLRVKAEQARIVLAIAAGTSERGVHLPAAERNRRRRAYHELRRLNARGAQP